MLVFLLCSFVLRFSFSFGKVPIRPTRLLPTDGSIIQCAGQTNQNFSDVSIQTFDNYTNYLQPGTKPQSFMIYFGLTLNVSVIVEWFNNFTLIMNNYSNNNWYSIQMGLWFYDIVNGKYWQPNDCMVMNGIYDPNIDAMINGFKQLGRPVFLRIGYEFNGVAWTGFTPDCYKGAYQRITNKLRADEFCNKYVATVWDYTADGDVNNYMSFYPGDNYVDWWGVNVFGCFETDNCANSNAGIGSPYINNFMLQAASKGYAIMIGESTPRQLGGGGSPGDPGGCLYPKAWETWYQPYFEMINNASYNIRAFCYINWWWWEWGYNWGMAEINECPNVGPKYQQEIINGSKKYFNAMNIADTKARFGLN